MRLFIFLFMSCLVTTSQAQQKLKIRTVSGEHRSPVMASILVKETTQVYLTDSTGLVQIDFSGAGLYTIHVTAIDHEDQKIKINIPYPADSMEIEMESSEDEMDEVIVQSTRTSRTIANVPTRVETIELEEIDEKNNMRPANVAMLLHESTGIQVQQTSATSANASIRIQGLDGRYTQLLKDGFANFGNFSSGLSVLEIPPLDLKQVEIIKGPASPLFGGGAIAGVVNFISKTPRSRPEYNFLINQSNIGQTNLGAFSSGRNEKLGYTFLGLYSLQKPYDVDNDDFTEVPKVNEYTLHPKLFYYPDENTTLILGNSLALSKRMGGDIQVINKNGDLNHQYFEKNNSLRNISTFELEKKIRANRFVFRQSFSVFDRIIDIPSYTFRGTDYNAYTDVSYIANAKKHAFVFGGNIIYNDFRERDGSAANRDNRLTTAGIYGQHTLDATDQIKLESGIRIDHAKYTNSLYSESETFFLPRISMLLTFDSQWSSRIGAGMGYKTPTLFTEETETIQYRNVAQLNQVRSEKSYGGTADINFRTMITGDLAFSFNHMFFYTLIQRPLILEDMGGIYHFVNAANPVHSAGMETNARFIYRDNFKLFLGYTFTNAKADYLSGNQFLTLVPKHKLNAALIYEQEGKIKLGLEGYFTGKQYLSNGTQSPAFEELGFMAEKIFRKFSIYINFENFTDTRQSKYKNVVNGSHVNPSFDEIWTHTEGFVVNGGIKIKL